MRGHWRLVTDIAGENHVPAAGRAHHIARRGCDGNAIQRCIQPHCGQRQGINFCCFHQGRARLRRSNGGNAAAGREIQHALAGHQLRIIQHCPSEGLPSRPGKGPEGRFDI
jgi:hypothetical protein